MKLPLHTLLIEDSEDDAFLILLNLRKSQFDIQSKRIDSEQALLAALDNESWDLILCDYQIPGFGGFQALAKVQERALDIPFIFVSGSMGEDVAVEAMHMGAHDYVMKGNLKRLMPAIERELKEAELRRAHKLSEAAIIQAKEDWERTFDAVPDLIAIMDMNFHIVRANKAMTVKLGLKPELCASLTCCKILHGLDHPHKDCPHALLLQDSKVHTSEFFEPILGGDFQVSVSPLFDAQGALIGSVHVARDVTERKRAEESLKWEQYLMQSLMDHFPDAIYFKDTKSRFTRISKNIAAKVGFENSEDLIGLTDFDLFSKEFAQLAIEGEQHIMNTGQSIINMEYKETYPDRPPTWVLTTKLPLYDAAGNIIGTFGISKDITMRKKAEEALLYEQYLMRTLMDNFPDAIYFKDLDSRFMRISKNHATRLGKENVDEIIGKSDFDLFSKAHAQMAFDDEQRIIHTGVPMINVEEEETFEDEESRWVLSTKLPLHDASGKIIGTFGISKDITERKKIEKALLYEQYLMRSLMDNIPESIYFKDLQSRFVRVNKNLCLRAGVASPEELVGLTDFDIIGHDLAQKAFNDEQNIIRTGHPMINTEEEESFPDRPSIYVLSTKLPLYDLAGNIIGTFGITRDISNNKIAEKNLQASEKRFRSYFEMPLIGFVVTATDKSWIDFNDRFCEILGYSREELMTKSWPEITHIEDLAIDLVNYNNVIDNKIDQYRIEKRFIRKDGSFVFVDLVVGCVRKTDGTADYLICLINDITEKKIADEELRKSEDKYRMLIQNQGEGLGIVDTNENFVFSNPAADHIFGVVAGKLINRNLKEFVSSEQFDLLVVETEKRSQLIKSSYEIEIISALGDKRSILVTATPQISPEGIHTGTFGVFRDITDMKRAEMELKKSLSLVKATLESTTDGILVVDTERKITGFNKRFETIWNTQSFTPENTDDNQLIQAVLFQLSNPESFLAKVNELYNNPDEESFDILDFKDGRVIERYSIPQRLDDKVVGRVWSFRDITERRQAEEERILSEQKYRELADFLPSGIFETDISGVISYANKVALEWIGYDENELYANINILQLVDEKDRKRADNRMGEILRSGKAFPGEYNICRKDGSIFPVLIITRSLLKDGKTLGLRGVISDLTQHKQAEKALRESEDSYTRAIETSLEGVLTTDSGNVITFVNHSMEEMLGYTYAELVGANIGTFVHANDLADHNKQYEERKKGLKARYQRRFRRKDGTLVWTEISASPVFASDGSFNGSFAMISDITDRLMTEKEVRMHRDHLEELVKERTEELISSQEKLKLAIVAAESANRAKSEFLANMSHEIRTPMNAILGFSDMLAASLKDEKQRSQVGSIRRSARSLMEIINDILDLSKIEAGKFIIQNAPISVYKLVKDIEIIFSQKIEEKGISFQIEASSEIPTLLLDETRLRQVLFNLVGNAVKFTEQGHVRLSLDKKINLKDKKRLDLIIAIEDTGIGIPKDQQQLIFNPFQQQEGQSTKKYGGTGLGLTITSRLVEVMGGKISLSSEPGKGSIFEITLSNIAISDEELLLKEEIVFNPKSVVFKEATVLIVDDNRENRNLIKDLLEFSPLILVEAENGREAVEKASEHVPDLILMDLVMPEMNGFEATQQLKKHKATKAIPVIAISASASTLVLEPEQKYIFSGILLKPVQLQELVDTMKKFLKYDIVITQHEDAEIPKTSLELPAGQIACLPEIIHILETEFMTDYKDMMQNQMINQMESFGKNMLAAGEKYSFQLLIRYGKDICQFADNFDINKLSGALKKFPGLIDELKAYKNNE